MKFTRMGQWHEISDNGAYVVSAASVMGEYKFQGFMLAPVKGKTAELLGTFDSVGDARTCCDDHERALIAARQIA